MPSHIGDHHAQHAATELIEEFLSQRYREEIATLAQHYPQDTRSLVVDHGDVYEFDPSLADDVLREPEFVVDCFEEALQKMGLVVDISLDGAHARPSNLPETQTYHPGEFSPSAHLNKLRAIEGEIAKATDDYARMETAIFECQRCGTDTTISQTDGGFQEPHECQGCERQGPFEIDYDQSEFVDAQKLKLQTPPEEAQGDGQSITVFVEDDYADVVTAGDRVTITGIVRLEQQGSQSQPANKFDPYVEGVHIDVDETDARDADITDAQRERIEELASGAEGDPLAIAADSIAPKIHGAKSVKRALVLALVGGSRVEYGDGDFDRGEFHVLLIGDPSTGKSKLVERSEAVGWRAVGVSGTGATKAGVTATAVQDDFGDGSWSLSAGAAVKANRGVLAIDELDDMPADVRSALLEPMSKQSIHMTKGGINTHLETRTAVIAAANPDRDRFDPFTAIAEQFTFSSTLLSRFDLVYTFRDVPDADADDDVAEHILSGRDSAKRQSRDLDLPAGAVDPSPAVEGETLRAWIALAKQQPEPVFADQSIKADIKESWTTLRGMYGYESPDDPVPVTFRSLEGIVRVAEAAAKFEFSATIEQRHADIATTLVGQSMQDIGKDPETGELDADIAETGASKNQKDREDTVIAEIKRLQGNSEDEAAEVDEVVENLSEMYDEGRIREDLRILQHRKGWAIEPRPGTIRFIGRR